VNPGFGGQKFIPAMIDKIRAAKAMIGARPIEIEVDGGITADTIGAATAAGANVFVAGSAVFQGGTVESYREHIAALRSAAVRTRCPRSSWSFPPLLAKAAQSSNPDGGRRP